MLTQETKGMLLGFVGVLMFSLTLPFTRIAVAELSPYFVRGHRQRRHWIQRRGQTQRRNERCAGHQLGPGVDPAHQPSLHVSFFRSQHPRRVHTRHRVIHLRRLGVHVHRLFLLVQRDRTGGRGQGGASATAATLFNAVGGLFFIG